MPTAFKIDVSFDGLSPSAELDDAVDQSVRRWSNIIKGWPAGANGFEIDKLRLRMVRLVRRAGPQGTLAFTDPRKLTRAPASAGPIAHLPVEATIAIDLHDVVALHLEARLIDMVTHEMGHALGLGTIWQHKGLVDRSNPDDPLYVGANAAKQYGILANDRSIRAVPLERRGDQYTRECHWRGNLFPEEILNGEVTREMWISRVTVGALEDLGYEVNLGEADFYRLPR